ncbi:MAG: DUF2188 domain-containing protein [Acholeplasmataceae bacterium]
MCFFWRKKKKNSAAVSQEETVVSQKEEAISNKKTADSHKEKETEQTKKAANAEPEKAAAKAVKYHVSRNSDPNSEHYKKWRVRKSRSQKTIKFFDTQKEAIDYATSLADSQGSSVVIHKVDGSIRKQDYTKKE